MRRKLTRQFWRDLFRSGGLRFTAFVVVVLTVGCALSAAFWDWLSAVESGSTTIRNVGLIFVGIIALPLAVWRGMVAERQAATAQKGLLNERYRQGAEMLGRDFLSVRLGGIYALQSLAQEHPEEYHIQIMRLLCAFVRTPPARDEGDSGEGTGGDMPSGLYSRREDVQAAMEAIGARREKHLILERKTGFRLDLRGANLSCTKLAALNVSGADLTYAVLSDANVMRANLSRANLSSANLSGAMLSYADLSNAKLTHANLSHALLFGANLSNTDLDNTILTRADLVGGTLSGEDKSPAIGLTQSQLDKARANSDDLPELDDVVDAETHEQLVWRGNDA